MESLVRLYALEVATGRMLLEHVPQRLREDVAAEAARLEAEQDESGDE